MTNVWNATINEQGNGLPDHGLYVPGDDGELYEIVAIDTRINTGSSPGQGNWCRARVEMVDWNDIDADEIFPAMAIVSE